MAEVIIYPTSDALITQGSYLTITPSSPATFFDKVDEVVADDSTTFISSNTTTVCGVDFGMGDVSGYESNSIQKITVFMRVGCDASANVYYDFQPRVNRIEFGTYTRKTGNTTPSYQNYTWEYFTNPSTGLPWTWTDINNLEVGFQWAGKDTKSYGYLTQLHVIVDYSPPPLALSGLVLEGVNIS